MAEEDRSPAIRRQLVVDLRRGGPFGVSFGELVDLPGTKREDVEKVLQEMLNAGEITRAEVADGGPVYVLSEGSPSPAGEVAVERPVEDEPEAPEEPAGQPVGAESGEERDGGPPYLYWWEGVSPRADGLSQTIEDAGDEALKKLRSVTDGEVEGLAVFVASENDVVEFEAVVVKARRKL